MLTEALTRKRDRLLPQRETTNVVPINVRARRHVLAGPSVHTPGQSRLPLVRPGLDGEVEPCSECGRGHRNFTKARREKILGYVRAGNYTSVAARASGATNDGMRMFMKDHPSFVRAMDEAKAESEARDLDFINGVDSWQARAWKLERKAVSRWGKIDRRVVSGPDGGPVKHQVAVLVVDAEHFSKAKQIAGSAVPMKALQDGSESLPTLDADFEELEDDRVDATS